MMNENNTNKKKGIKLPSLNQRKFRYGGFSIVLIVIVIAAVILLNIAADAVETNWALSIDVTAINATDFEDLTYEIVDGVQEDVHVYTLFQNSTSSTLRAQVDSVLEKYHALNGKIEVNNIDPINDPTKVNKYAGDKSVAEGAVIVTNADETKTKVIDKSDYYSYQTSQYTGYSYTIFNLEEKVTAALAYVTSDETPVVYYLTGHDEFIDGMAYCTLLNAQLESRNYEIAALNLQESDTELLPGDTVIIADPQRDLTDEEYETLRNWLSNGGRMLFDYSYNMDPAKTPNFLKLLSYFNLSYGDGVVVEDINNASYYWNSSNSYLKPVLNAEHEITTEMAANNNYVVVPQPRPINAATPDSGTTYTTLLTTSPKATIVNGDEVSAPGEQILALAAERGDTRIIQLSSYYLFADTQLLLSSYDMNFTIKAIDWLVNSQSTIDMDDKYITDSMLIIPDSTTAWTLVAICVVVLPLLVTAAGIFVWIKRRRL